MVGGGGTGIGGSVVSDGIIRRGGGGRRDGGRIRGSSGKVNNGTDSNIINLKGQSLVSL